MLVHLKVKSRGLVFINGIWQRDRDSLVSKQNVEKRKKHYILRNSTGNEIFIIKISVREVLRDS